MNIQGFKFLKQNGFPTPRVSTIFRIPTEIDWSRLRRERNTTKYIVVGFDDTSSIYDHPYQNRGVKLAGISITEVTSAWESLSMELSSTGIKTENQIYLLLEEFTGKMIDISGMVSKVMDANWFGRVAIDFMYQCRPMGCDWHPDCSVVLPVVAGRYFWSQLTILTSSKSPPAHLVSRLVRDVRRIPQNVHLDFELMIDGHFLYHDLFFLKPI